jgi:hypothetical protein
MLKNQIRPTLVSSDDSIWKNETGFATQLLVDMQVLFACVRVSELGGSQCAPLTNKERQHFKLVRSSLPMSSRMALAIRSSCSFRNSLAIKLLMSLSLMLTFCLVHHLSYFKPLIS